MGEFYEGCVAFLRLPLKLCHARCKATRALPADEFARKIYDKSSARVALCASLSLGGGGGAKVENEVDIRILYVHQNPIQT